MASFEFSDTTTNGSNSSSPASFLLAFAYLLETSS
jgi:hypothetical protein